MSDASLRRRVIVAGLAAAGVPLALACTRPAARGTGRLSWVLSPDPPRVGPAVLVLSLVDPGSHPVTGARWQVEGDMTHPGMPPVAAAVVPRGEGRYEARLPFTMAGDWVLLARAEWGDGQRLEQEIPVRVRP